MIFELPIIYIRHAITHAAHLTHLRLARFSDTDEVRRWRHPDQAPRLLFRLFPLSGMQAQAESEEPGTARELSRPMREMRLLRKEDQSDISCPRIVVRGNFCPDLSLIERFLNSDTDMLTLDEPASDPPSGL